MSKTRINAEAKQKSSPAQDCAWGSVKGLANGQIREFARLFAKGESPALPYVVCGNSSKGALQSGNGPGSTRIAIRTGDKLMPFGPKIRAFLAAIRVMPNVTRAAHAAKIHKSQHYFKLKSSSEYAAAFQ